MRLGQILVAAGRISPAQLDEALRAQVLYGGRLGTNLIELGYLDLDGLALALARRHGIPAALLKHFERCDLTVQSRLPPALAGQWCVIPIGHLADRRARIAVAAMDPLPAPAASAIAEALRVAPTDLVVSIAGELRIRYYLERCYGIARESRFLRIRRATQSGVPVPPPDALEPETETGTEPDIRFGAGAAEPDDAAATIPIERFTADDIFPGEEGDATTERPPIRAAWPPATAPAPATDSGLGGWRAGDRAATVDLGIDAVADAYLEDRAPTAPHDEPAETGQAVDDAFAVTFDLFAEEPPAEPEPPRRDSRPPGGMIDFEVSDDASQRLEMQRRRRFVRTLSESDVEADAAPAAPAPAARGTLARIPIRRMAPVREDSGDPTTLEESERAVRRAVSRDRVGELVAGALARFSAAEVGAVFVIREPVAIGWKGVVRGQLVALDSVAVAIDEPGALLATAHDREGIAVVDPRCASPVDRRLWRALGCGEPPCAVATRVAIAGHPVCLLYVHGDGVDGAHDVVSRLADATRTAFTRLLRAAQR